METDFGTLTKEARKRDAYWIADVTHQFTEELFRRMEANNITKADLARATGTSRAYITKVMKGNANLTIATMVKLTRAVDSKLNITLFKETTKKKSKE